MARKFSEATLNKFREIFKTKRQEIIININKVGDDTELDGDGDEVDLIQARVLKDVSAKLSQREINLLNRINSSLEKIDNGTFGICEDCDGRIGEKRLLAVPGCSICIDCAEEQEKFERQFG